MKRLLASRDFQKQLDRLSLEEREKAWTAVRAFQTVLRESAPAKSLGLKKLAKNKYEIRADLKTRIGIIEDGDTFVLIFIGNHEDIRNFLKNY